MQLFVGKSGRWCIGLSGEQLTVNKFFISDGSWGELTWSPIQSGNCLENSGIQMYLSCWRMLEKKNKANKKSFRLPN